MHYDFDTVLDRRNTDSLKWDKSEEMFGAAGLLPMWVADTDFRVAPAITDALRERLDHGVFGYTFRGAAFHEAILGWVKRRYRWDIQRDWIVFSPGTVPALSLAVLAHTRPGDSILIQPPVYGAFHEVVAGNGRQLLQADLTVEGEVHRMDFDALERQVNGRTRMLILCNPHNPVGRVWRKEELERLAAFVCKHDLLLISDEIHADLVFEGHQHVSIASLSPEMEQRTITCCAPSKTFGLAGLSTAYAVIPNEKLRRGFKEILEAMEIDGGNIFGKVALTAAYTRCDDWLAQLLRYLEANRDHAAGFLRDRVPCLRPVLPEGTYLMWLDCRPLGFSNPEELSHFFFHEAKVAISRGAYFGAQYSQFVRLNFGCPRSLLTEGLHRIEGAAQARLNRKD